MVQTFAVLEDNKCGRQMAIAYFVDALKLSILQGQR